MTTGTAILASSEESMRMMTNAKQSDTRFSVKLRGAAALCLALLCVPPSAAASHRNHVSGSHAVKLSQQLSVFPALANTAAVARYRLADRTDLFLEGFDQQSREVLARALTVDGKSDVPWPLLMRGAVQVRQQKGPAGQTLWFNPVFDAGLILRWKLGDEGWRVTDAWLVLGTDIREETPQSVPDFALPIGKVAPVKSGDRAPQYYPLEHPPFARAMAADWQPPGPSEERSREAAGRVRAAGALLGQLKRQPGFEPVLNRTLDAITMPGRIRDGVFDVVAVRALAAMGRAGRAGLRPVSAYDPGDGSWRLILQSIDAPAVAFEASYDAKTSRFVALRAFAYGETKGHAQ